MKFLIRLTIGTVFIFVVIITSFAQSTKYRASESLRACRIPTPSMLKKSGSLDVSQEVAYRSPIRYLIVYNDIQEDASREITVYLSRSNFNEENLKTLFCWIEEKYASSSSLTVYVHTSLNTIETPDERELLRDGDDERFSRFYGKTFEATYIRSQDKSASFNFTSSISPYREKTVVLKKLDGH